MKKTTIVKEFPDYDLRLAKYENNDIILFEVQDMKGAEKLKGRGGKIMVYPYKVLWAKTYYKSSWKDSDGQPTFEEPWMFISHLIDQMNKTSGGAIDDALLSDPFI